MEAFMDRMGRPAVGARRATRNCAPVVEGLESRLALSRTAAALPGVVEVAAADSNAMPVR